MMPAEIFEWMATPRLAALPFTPEETEQQVVEYIEQLSAATRREDFDPAGGVNALVFGEWGHGKSQVLFRTVNSLEGRSDVLAIRVIPAKLSCADLLRATAKGIADAGFAYCADALYGAADELPAIDDNELIEDSTKKIASVAGDVARRHVVFLLDEAAQWRNFDLQHFLRELVRAFSACRIQLHTLQCHSLATLDKARQMAAEVGEWLASAVQIHLPAIRVDDAHAFFASRILAVSRDPELSSTLLSPGIARVICQAAGGNPRYMLQYAQAVAEIAVADGRLRCTGNDLVAAFTSIPVAQSQSLFVDRAFRRVTGLLPQEWEANIGRKLAHYLVDNLGYLYGEEGEVKAETLAAALSVNVPVLQAAVARKVGGVQVLDSTNDDFGDSSFKLSSDFRHRLTNARENSGTVDLKRYQVELIVGPERHQTRLAKGMLQALQRGKLLSRNNSYKALGVTSKSSAGEAALGGQVVDVLVPQSTHHARCLITALLGIAPPAEFADAIAKGLVDGAWSLAFVYYANPKLTWNDWRNTDAGARFFEALGSRARQVIAHLPLPPRLDESESAEESTDVWPVKYFANIRAVAELTGAAELPKEVASVADATAAEFDNELMPHIEFFCYLPEESERKLLEDASWKSGGGMTLESIKGIAPSLASGKALQNLLGEYVEKRGHRYYLTEFTRWRLVERVRGALATGDQMSLDAISKRVKAQECFLGGEHLLSSVIGWILHRLQEAGQATEEDGAWSFVDVEAIKRRLRNECGALVDDCAALRAELLSFDQGVSSRDELGRFDAARQKLDEELERPDLEEVRDALRTAKSDLESAVRRNAKTREAILEFMRAEVERVRRAATGISTDLVRYLGLDDELAELNSECDAAEGQAFGANGRVQQALSDVRVRVTARANRLIQIAGGQALLSSETQGDRLVAEILRRRCAFQAVRVWA